MHPVWLSNTYLVADEPGGTAVFIDSGGPIESLLEAVERERLSVTHVLRTHGHTDHVVFEDELRGRFGVDVVTGSVQTGGLDIRALSTPGHSDDGLSFVVNEAVCFTGDTLFRDAVGGGDPARVRSSVMDTLMTLRQEGRVLRGHTDETTIGREWEHNPCVLVGRGAVDEGSEQVHVAGEPATLV